VPRKNVRTDARSSKEMQKLNKTLCVFKNVIYVECVKDFICLYSVYIFKIVIGQSRRNGFLCEFHPTVSLNIFTALLLL
jgi:hypothetical protein